MGKKDIPQKIFWEDNERFADLFNVVLGQGEIIVQPEDLTKEDATISEVVKKENHKIFVEKYRDVIKRVTTDLSCFLIGIENQSEINYAMPLRVMLWDALSYQEQLRELERNHKGKNDLTYSAEFLSGMKKSEKLKPVCTIVLYFSEQEWDGPKCLHELLEWEGIPEQLKLWVADYPMVLVDVYRFEEWEKFQTDLREVFGFIQSSVDKEKMKQFLKKYEKDLGAMSEDACEMIESITGTANIRKFRMRQKEEKNMCKAIDDMMQEKYEEGREYERMNTERERRRADELVKRISELEKEICSLKQKLA